MALLKKVKKLSDPDQTLVPSLAYFKEKQEEKN